jgi:hypothetical protein
MGRLRAGAILLLVTLSLAGCTAVRKVEGRDDSTMTRRLEAAGFRPVPADTPEKKARLAKMPDRLFTKVMRDGKPYYVVADARGCNCMYVGNERAYLRNQDLEIQGEMAAGKKADALAVEDAAAVDRLDYFWSYGAYEQQIEPIYPTDMQP